LDQKDPAMKTAELKKLLRGTLDPALRELGFLWKKLWNSAAPFTKSPLPICAAATMGYDEW